jgi:hypothetical protein
MNKKITSKNGVTMKSKIPRELLKEAKANPGGWVYEIDPRYDPNGRVPVSGIVRAWKISQDGDPTGEVWENPQHEP